jgi:hypothetical protein
MTRPSIRLLHRVLLSVLSIIFSISLNLSAAAGNDATNFTQQGFMPDNPKPPFKVGNGPKTSTVNTMIQLALLVV